MGGYDLVLGVDWVGSLNPVTFYYKKLLLQFQHQGKLVTLKGNLQSSRPRVQQMSARAFIRSCQRQGNGFLYLVNALPITQGSINSIKEEAVLSDAEIKGHLQQLLEEDENIFKPPVGLPPHRDIEHSIELKEGS